MPVIHNPPGAADNQTSPAENPLPVPAPAPVDPAKGNALLKKLFRVQLPIVPDPAPPQGEK